MRQGGKERVLALIRFAQRFFGFTRSVMSMDTPISP